MNMKEACKISNKELETRGCKSFDCFGGKTCFILKDGEAYRGFVNVCPHMGGPTEPQEREDGKKVLKCQWHGAEFDFVTGQALTPPAPKGSGLRKLSLIVKDGVIYYS